MRLGLFFSKEEKDVAESLIDGLRDLKQCQVHAYQIEPGWAESDGQELQFHFSRTDLFVLVLGERRDPFSLGSWSYLLLGFVMGLDAGMGFFAHKPLTPGSLYKHVPVHYNLKDLRSFVQDEFQIWQQDHRVQQARERLIDQGIGLNEENLARRVELGDSGTVEDFLTIGFSPDSLDPQGTPILVLAARNGHDALVLVLIKRGANPNLPSQDRGNTALMESAMRGALGLGLALYAGGADLDIQSKSGQTALMLAIADGHQDFALHLISHGASLEPVDQLGMTARKYAALFGHQRVLDTIEAVTST